MNTALLKEGLHALSLAPSSESESALPDKLIAYIEAIEKWNPTHGLVGASGDELIVKHILDSLAPLAIFDRLLAEARGAGRAAASAGRTAQSVASARLRPSLADLGTGAGLPGIPLALARPDIDVTLIDRMTRRIHFLEAMKKDLPITNIDIVEAQVEHAKGSWDLVVFRAFRPFERKLFRRVFSICSPEGFVAAYKGRRERVEEELGELEGLYASYEIVPVTVPFLADERCLVILRPASKSALRASAGK